MKKTTLLCVCGVASWAARAALPDPIAYFSFDEIRDGAIADLSGNGRTLTVGPGCSLTNDAASGSALWLDGTTSTYATFQSPVLKQRTISLWYKRCHQPGPNFEEKYGASDNNCRMPTLIAGLSKFNLRFNNSWANSSDHSLGIGNHDLVAYYGDSAYYSDSYFSYNRYPQLYPERWTHLAWAIEVTDSEYATEEQVGAHRDTFNLRFYVNGELWFSRGGGATTNAFAAQTTILGNNAVNGSRPCRGAAAVDAGGASASSRSGSTASRACATTTSRTGLRWRASRGRGRT